MAKASRTHIDTVSSCESAARSWLWASLEWRVRRWRAAVRTSKATRVEFPVSWWLSLAAVRWRAGKVCTVAAQLKGRKGLSKFQGRPAQCAANRLVRAGRQRGHLEPGGKQRTGFLLVGAGDMFNAPRRRAFAPVTVLAAHQALQADDPAQHPGPAGFAVRRPARTRWTPWRMAWLTSATAPSTATSWPNLACTASRPRRRRSSRTAKSTGGDAMQEDRAAKGCMVDGACAAGAQVHSQGAGG